MFEIEEIISLMLFSVALIFVLRNGKRIGGGGGGSLLIVSFELFFAGTVLTVLEGYFLGDLLNLLEHLSYLASAASLLASVALGPRVEAS